MTNKFIKIFFPMSQKKLYYLNYLLHNKNFKQSLNILQKDYKLPSKILLKKLKQNITNLKNFKINTIIINKSKTLHRVMFRAKGRTSIILKKHSVVFLIFSKNE